MHDYEELLPIDPIGALEKIKENYRRYFDTMYKFRERTDNDVDGDLYEDLNQRKEELWDPQNGTPKDLYNDPYVELLPEYKTSGETLGELLDREPYRTELAHIDPHFVEFIKAGLMPDQPNKPYKPYEHQIEMLRKAFGHHGLSNISNNVVITSGTGSGKTESFLLPLFASLLSEAKQWGKSEYKPKWFETKGEEYDNAYQRVGEAPNRKAAIRAMVMYPMNALVEDQVARLREALDSNAAREVLERFYKGNRIFFGRYTGATMGSKNLAYHERTRKTDKQGNPLPVAKMQEVKEELAKLADKARQLQGYIANPNNDQKAEFISPRLGVGAGSKYSSEMITRWDMQECPPDILITNVSMLNIMLMREAEKGMLQKTRDWYTAKGLDGEEKERAKKERVFHLIVDELHLYRGTAGTEVSYLLRMFLDRIGVPPTIEDPVTHMQIPNPQLRILASSASLGDTDDETIDYLEQFFGVYYEDRIAGRSFQVQNGDPFGVENYNLTVPYSAFEVFAQRVRVNDKDRIRFIYDEQSQDAIKQEFINHVNDQEVNSISAFMSRYAGQIYYDLQSLTINEENGRARFVPISINSMLPLFDNNIDALRGFFIFRGDDEVCQLSEQYKLPRMRFHQFFKYVEGLWGELLPRTNGEQRAIGRLMLQSQEYDPATSHKVLELLRCECCGEVYIGGNRHFDGYNRDTFVLSLNSPNLNSIPNRNPTPMVQDKLYKDYGVFWPTNEVTNSPNGFFTDKFNTANNNRKTAYDITQSEGRWVEGYLNPYDGTIKLCPIQNIRDFTSWIHGFVYMIYRNDTNNGTISPLEDSQMALPCLCPHCNADYHRRTYTKSPLRSFRSGFKRSNQILSKELMYQLPNDNRKLIGFSDSRQDAAEQSYGIAQEHYRDMVRLAFLQSLDERGKDEERALRKLKKNLCRDIDDPDESFDDMVKSVNDTKYITKDTKDDLIAILRSNSNGTQKQSEINAVSITTNVIPLDNFIGESLDGYVVKKLLEVKMNPAGIDLCDQTYDVQNLCHHWTDLYDFTELKAVSATDTNNFSSHASNTAKQNLTKVLFQICVGKYMGITTEDAGIGYLSVPQNYVITNQKFNNFANQCECDPIELVNAYIRILGDNYRYDSDDVDYSNVNPNKLWGNYSKFSNNVKKPLEVISNENGIDSNDFGRELFVVLAGLLRTNQDLKLNWSHLSFNKVAPDSSYYKCPKCGRIHLHKGLGICTNTACCEELIQVPNSTVQDIYPKHYIAYDTKVEPRDACRIHTEELTGQTDDQPTRLLEFKGIILDNMPDNAKEAKVIDMVNVTTTMEVGVDIGGLLAVYQGNMPPTRYNYQQRVGRGGRRGQAFSMAMTFCRGKSHDTYYYDKGADEMTGGLPALPKLSIKPQNGIFNDAIVRRVLLKHILRQAYLDENLCTKPEEDNTDSDSTKLELGLWANWDQTIRPALVGWLQKDRDDVIEKTVDLYLKQYARAYNTDPRDEIIRWIKRDVLNEIDIVKKHKQCDSIAQDLVESGLLPIYGLPSSIRDFYHGKANYGEYKVISRSLEESISEFAPGAIKIKDHGFYKSDGITVPLKTRKYKDYNDFSEDPVRWDALENSYSIQYNGDSIASITPGYITGQNGISRLVIPKAYRTLKLDSNGKLNENEDRSHYSSTKIWVDDTHSNTQGPKNYKNLDITYWNSAANDNPIIWFINDNNGKRFNGSSQYALDNQGISINPKFFNENIRNYNQNDPTAIKFIDHAPNFMSNGINGSQVISGAPEGVALGAKKVTELLKLKVRKCPDSIELRLKDAQGNDAVEPIIGAAIKAAYYSAATLIQRVFADEQDIQPEEVQLSEVQIDSDGYPYIYLSDALANGSGYMKILQDLDPNNQPHIINIMKRIVNGEGTYMQSLMSQEHKHDCKSSCAKCLRTYQNQGYHHVLDWRLGIDLIKLMLDPNYDMGQNIPTPYGDLYDIFDEVGVKVQNANSALRIEYDRRNKCLKTAGNWGGPLATTAADKFEMIVHPLWKHDARVDQNIFQLLRGVYTPKPGRSQMYAYSHVIDNEPQQVTNTGRNLLGD